jgi:hypothetical protein
VLLFRWVSHSLCYCFAEYFTHSVSVLLNISFIAFLFHRLPHSLCYCFAEYLTHCVLVSLNISLVLLFRWLPHSLFTVSLNISLCFCFAKYLTHCVTFSLIVSLTYPLLVLLFCRLTNWGGGGRVAVTHPCFIQQVLSLNLRWVLSDQLFQSKAAIVGLSQTRPL